MVLAIINYKSIESNGYKFPYWTYVLGNFISASTLLGIVIWPIYLVINNIFIKKMVVFFCFN